MSFNSGNYLATNNEIHYCQYCAANNKDILTKDQDSEGVWACLQCIATFEGHPLYGSHNKCKLLTDAERATDEAWELNRKRAEY